MGGLEQRLGQITIDIRLGIRSTGHKECLRSEIGRDGNGILGFYEKDLYKVESDRLEFRIQGFTFDRGFRLQLSC